jgi:hypothetical protein
MKQNKNIDNKIKDDNINDNINYDDSDSNNNNNKIDDYSSDSSEEDTDIQQVVYRKTLYKELRKEVLKNQFDKNKIFNISEDSTLEENIMRDKVDIADERKQLINDGKLINKAISAVQKMSEGKIPISSEYKAYSTIKNKYDTFFDDEDIGANKNFEEDKGSLDNVKEYVSDELKANRSRKKEIESISFEETKSTKRNFEDTESLSSSSSSSKKIKTTNDYIDSLPKDYNPFDDIGDD